MPWVSRATALRPDDDFIKRGRLSCQCHPLIPESPSSASICQRGDPRPGATEQDHDCRTDETIARIVATGEAFFGGTTWRGRRCMRVSACNWRTDDRDVERAVRAAQGVLGNQPPDGG